MTRVVGGNARGRRLKVPPGGTRPTSDRAREAVFSMLESIRGPVWADAQVLDLYAGSGALGLEALSRGAGRVDLVESDRHAARVIEDNIAVVVPVSGRAQVHRVAVERWVRRVEQGARYEVVFCDPPYDTDSDDVRAVLSTLREVGALAPGCLLVVERAQRDAWTWPDGIGPVRDRRYGEARVWIGST